MDQLALFKTAHYIHGTVYMYAKRGCRCDECRTAATKHRRTHSQYSCSRCGGKTQSKAATAVCHECRRATPEPHSGRKGRACAICGKDTSLLRRYKGRQRIQSDRKYCSDECRLVAHPKTEPPDPYYRRANSQPGLTTNGRLKLLRKWRNQSRTCFYCGGLPETVDHVMPLKLGGTNFEGNLVPCCRSCNGSKNALTLMEWRLRRGQGQAA